VQSNVVTVDGPTGPVPGELDVYWDGKRLPAGTVKAEIRNVAMKRPDNDLGYDVLQSTQTPVLGRFRLTGLHSGDTTHIYVIAIGGTTGAPVDLPQPFNVTEMLIP